VTINRPRTWIEVAVLNGGFRKALRALDWAHSWVHVQVAFGRDPSAEEVAEWWNMSQRTAYRDQAAFRACFPKADSPMAIYANNPAALEAIKTTVKALERIDADKRAKQARRDADVLGTGLLAEG
jgi:hypothetical protein